MTAVLWKASTEWQPAQAHTWNIYRFILWHSKLRRKAISCLHETIETAYSATMVPTVSIYLTVSVNVKLLESKNKNLARLARWQTLIICHLSTSIHAAADSKSIFNSFKVLCKKVKKYILSQYLAVPKCCCKLQLAYDGEEKLSGLSVLQYLLKQ